MVPPRVKMDGKGVVHAKDEEWVLCYDAQFVLGITDGSGVWFVGGEDDAQHMVDFGGDVGSADAYFFGGDDMHDVVSCD
jgi:hypothetical protein